MNIEKLLEEAETLRDKVLIESYRDFSESGAVIVFESNETDVHKLVSNPDFETKVLISGIPKNLVKGLCLIIAEISIHSGIPVDVLKAQMNDALDSIKIGMPSSVRAGEGFPSFSNRMISAFYEEEIQHFVTLKNPTTY